METIFTSDQIKVVRFESENEYVLEDFKYFKFVPKYSTHMPDFPKKKLFINLGGAMRWFIPEKTIFGLRYPDEKRILSPIITATFCQMEGVDGICAILGNYSQSHQQDELDSMGPGDDCYGVWNDLWSKYPENVFYYEDEDSSNGKMLNFIPSLKRAHSYNREIIHQEEYRYER